MASLDKRRSLLYLRLAVATAFLVFLLRQVVPIDGSLGNAASFFDRLLVRLQFPNHLSPLGVEAHR